MSEKKPYKFILNPDFNEKRTTEIIKKIWIFLSTLPTISYDPNDPRVKAFAVKKINHKISTGQKCVVKDPHKPEVRSEHGLSGEQIVEIIIDEEFVDLSIGDSGKYNYADLRPIGLKVGVKTGDLSRGNCPVIKPDEKDPQIIIFIHPETKKAWCPGVMFPPFNDVDIELVKDLNIINNGKAAAYKIKSRCIPFKDNKELRYICRDYTCPRKK